MLVIAWLGILMPTFAGVQVESTRDPVVRAILSSLCLAANSGGTQDGSDESTPSKDSSGYQCFFCFPSTNASHGCLAPESVALPVIALKLERWDTPLVVRPLSRRPIIPRARDPPLSFS